MYDNNDSNVRGGSVLCRGRTEERGQDTNHGRSCTFSLQEFGSFVLLKQISNSLKYTLDSTLMSGLVPTMVGLLALTKLYEVVIHVGY